MLQRSHGATHRQSADRPGSDRAGSCRAGSRRRSTRFLLTALGTTALFASTATVALTTAASASTKSTKAAAPNLAGVTITFADQFKEYQTILTAANALQGAQYTVNWQEFVGGPPIIAAETGGSVDLGDMAETPTIFAQAAGDPVKVVAATLSANPKVSPFDLVVPATSTVKKISQLKGQSIGVQEGTVEQYVLIQILKKAGVAYSGVNIENLSVVNAATAVSSGKVGAALISQPLTAIDLAAGKIRVLATGAGYTQTIGYLTASQAALNNPQKAAAIADFIQRFYKAEAFVKLHPQLAINAYVKIYGVTEAEAKQAAATVVEAATPITPAIISYQQTEANTFLKLGLITKQLNVKGVFDLPLNKSIDAKAGLK
jgi:sulfonate transport system substrate-binding protein